MNKTESDFMRLFEPVEKPKWLFAIRQLRLDKNWMQQDVALALNIPLVEYSSIENAKRLPNDDFFQKISTVYGLNEQDIVELRALIKGDNFL